MARPTKAQILKSLSACGDEALDQLVREVRLDVARSLSRQLGAGPAAKGRRKKTGRPPTSIPADKRTIPLSLRRAAKLLGKTGNPKDAAEWLRLSIDDGSYQAEQVSRQSWIFNIDAFHESVHQLLLPQVAATGGKRR